MPAIANSDVNIGSSFYINIAADVEVGGMSNTIVLPDDKEVFTVTPEIENGAIDTSMILDEYFLYAKADSVGSAVFEKSGKVSIEEVNGDYRLDLAFNDGKGELPWFNVEVYGYSNASEASLEIANEGMILNSDNMSYVEVLASNRKDNVALKFSTDETSVHIKAVDDNTLGIYIDRDKDGVYETLIADSNGTDYGSYGDPSDNPSNDNSSSDMPSDDNSSFGDISGDLSNSNSSDGNDFNNNLSSEPIELSQTVADNSESSVVNDNSLPKTQETGDSTIPVFIASVLAVISGITAWFISRRKKGKQ